jgi:hypothetical protein
LRQAQYEESDLFNKPYEDPYHSYVFLRDLKLLHSVDVDAETNSVHFHPERLYPDIDLAETLRSAAASGSNASPPTLWNLRTARKSASPTPIGG